MHTAQLSGAQGHDVFQYARWQEKYGDRGLSSNIVIPTISVKGFGTQTARTLAARVIVSDPADAERLSRTHVRKEGNFEPALLDGVIATTDNEFWKQQRAHLSEAFLPLSSLAE